MTGIGWAALAAGAAAQGFAAYTDWRTRRKLAEMAQAVADIRAGNGNRRILADEHEPAAPLVFAVNEIVLGYEARIAALQKAEEANRQLMTSLSHDVRTPLTTLIGYLDAAHRGVLAGADRDASLETARRKAHELKDYINALFDWFQLHSREAALRCEPVEAAELTREILADWVPLFEEQGLAYHIDIPDGPLTARLDPDAYRRILNNLLQNVLAHANAARVSVTLARQGAALALHVTDDGAGIAPADLPHVFERLYKCDKSRGRHRPGADHCAGTRRADGRHSFGAEPACAGRGLRRAVSAGKMNQIPPGLASGGIFYKNARFLQGRRQVDARLRWYADGEGGKTI